MGRTYGVEAEQVLLGSAMSSLESARMICAVIDASDFRGQENKVVFGAIRACVSEGMRPSALAVAAHSPPDGGYGGIEYLRRLEGLGVLPAEETRLHADRLKKCAARDRLLDRMDRLKAIVNDQTKTHEEVVRAVMKEATALASAGVPARDTGLAERWISEMERWRSGDVPFVSTGYPALDGVLAEGFARGKVTVIAARPRMGKSTMVADMVRRLLRARKKPRILVAPLEVGEMVFLSQVLGADAGIGTEMLTKTPADLTMAQAEELKRLAKKVVGTDDRLEVLSGNPFPLLSKTRGRWSNETALDKMEEIVSAGRYDLAIWDLWERALPNTREPQEVASALFRFHSIMEAYGCHGVIVHQLVRTLEKQRDRRPKLTDLKGSGGYEEVADLVLLLHRERAYYKFCKDDLIEVWVAKQRRGRDDAVVVADFVPQTCELLNDRLTTQEEITGGSDSFTGSEDPV